MYFLLQSYLHTHTDKATWLTRTIPTSTLPTLTIPTRTCVTNPNPNPTCAHVDLGAGLLQYADNRPTIITLVGMVAVGMVRVGMVPAPLRSTMGPLRVTANIVDKGPQAICS